MVKPIVPVPSPFPNLEIPEPWWINQLKNFILMQCVDPSLMYIELALPAALKAAWTIATPSTKQIIHKALGRSWVCEARSVLSGAEEADELANDANTRFMYGLWRGLDTFAYFQFIADISGQGLINWHSMIHKSEQHCAGSKNSHYGTTAYGGWVGTPHIWNVGAQYLNNAGGQVFTTLTVPAGHTVILICALKCVGLYNGYPVPSSNRIVWSKGGNTQVADQASIVAFDKPTNMGLVGWQSGNDVGQPDMTVYNETRFDEYVDGRVVAASGFCYAEVSPA